MALYQIRLSMPMEWTIEAGNRNEATNIAVERYELFVKAYAYGFSLERELPLLKSEITEIK